MTSIFGMEPSPQETLEGDLRMYNVEEQVEELIEAQATQFMPKQRLANSYAIFFFLSNL